MRIRRKQNNCLNCGASLDGTYNYCPICGQENNDNNVSFGTLLNDFFSNYFAFDSRFAKSIGPFIFKPGFLTNRYMEGKRMSYAHPLRLYLVISLFYFFIFSVVVTDMLENADDSIDEMENQLTNLEFLPKTDREILKETLSAKSMEGVLKEMEMKGTANYPELIKAIETNTTEEERLALQELLNSGLADSLRNYMQDTTARSKLKLSGPDAPLDTSVTVDSSADFFLFEHLEKIYTMSKQRSLSGTEIIDSLKTRPVSRFERYSTEQAIRVMRAEKEQVGAYIVKNLPLMMLILIPIFALVLKLLYIRRDFLYINHVIHGFHLHSFAYLMYGITIILTYYVFSSDSWRGLLNFGMFVIVTTYAYISFLRV